MKTQLTNKAMCRAQVFVISYLEGFGLNQVHKKVYVGYTTEGLDKALSENKNRVKNVKNSNVLKSLKVDVNKLEISFLTNTTVAEAPALVNHYINKFDTMNNGWNSSLR